ncbi:hypothetical protein G9A89_013571 [Geosiphon pyriformis]|nr:hypothetical protein G9A89_013571 [Geosiphon pyriformis]
MAASNTMNFGPEWMRCFPKTPTAESTRATSPPLGGSSNTANVTATTSTTGTTNNNTGNINSANGNGTTTNTFSWSSVAAANSNSIVSNRGLHHEPSEKSDVPGGAESALSPFKYSKEFMLKLYKPVGLPLEFERHEYVTSDEPLQPMAMIAYTEQEHKLLSGASVNSELTRRIVSNVSVATTTGVERIVDKPPFSPREKPPSTGLTSPRTERFGTTFIGGVLSTRTQKSREGGFSLTRRDSEKEDDREINASRSVRPLRTLSLSLQPNSPGDELIWNGNNRHAVGTFDSHGVFRIPGISGTDEEFVDKKKTQNDRNQQNEENEEKKHFNDLPQTRADEKSEPDEDVSQQKEPSELQNDTIMEAVNDFETQSEDSRLSSEYQLQEQEKEQELQEVEQKKDEKHAESEHSSSLSIQPPQSQNGQLRQLWEEPKQHIYEHKPSSPPKEELKTSITQAQLKVQTQNQHQHQQILLIQQQQEEQQHHQFLQQRKLIQGQQQQKQHLIQEQKQQQILQEQQQFLHHQQQQQQQQQKQHLLQQQLLPPQRSPISSNNFDSDQDDDVLKAAFAYPNIAGTTPPLSPGLVTSKYSTMNSAFGENSSVGNSLFANSGINIETRKTTEQFKWLYRDPTGNIQGPFTSQEMNDWFKGGFFVGSLMVKRVEDPAFEPLAALIRKTGDADRPFSATILNSRPPLTIAMPNGQGRLVNDPFQRGWGAPSSPSTAQLFLEHQQRFNPFGGTTSVPSTPFDRYQFGSVFGNRNEVSNGWNDLGTVNNGWTPSENFPAATGNLSPRLQTPSSPLFTSSTSTFGVTQTHNFLEHQRVLTSQIERQQQYYALMQQQRQQQQQQQNQHVFSDAIFRPHQGFAQTSAPISAPIIPNAPNTPYSDVIARATAWSTTNEQPPPPPSPSPWGSIVAPSVGPNSSRVPSHEETGYFGLRKEINIGLPQPLQFETSIPQPNEQRSYEISATQNPDAALDAKVNTTAESIAKVVLEDEEVTPTRQIDQVIQEEKRELTTTKANVESISSPQPSIPKKEETLKSRPSLREIQADEERKKLLEEKEKAATGIIINSSTIVSKPGQSQKSANPAWGGTSANTLSSAPWAKDDDHLPHKTPSLREIQEMETRKTAERKAAERLNAINIAAQAPVLSNKEDVSSINASWGIIVPNSSTTTASNSSSLSTSPVVTAPAWHSNNVAPKKTLREIQKEEEEATKKRNKLREIQQQALLNAAAVNNNNSSGLGKRYADTVVAGTVIGSVKKPAAPATGSAWTVVAANKPANSRTVSNALASQNLSSTINSGTNSTIKVGAPSKETGLIWDLESHKAFNGLPGSQRSEISSSKAFELSRTVKSAIGSNFASIAINGNNPTSGLDQIAPRAPSEEFLKWCRTTLRPLNNINVDEFIQMLLTFPLDPPPNTIEIIQESIYSYSTNLDGRRFADEFVKRRKADAAGIPMSSYSSLHGEGKLMKDIGGIGTVGGVKEESTSTSTNAFKVVTTKKGKKKH